MLSLDNSLFVVIALVWILMIVLDKIYFKPVKDVLDRRDSKIAGETAQIESLMRELEDKTAKIEDILNEAKRESARIKEELIKEGETTREKIIDETRGDCKGIFKEKMIELSEEIAAAEKSLKKEIDSYSSQLKEIFI